MRFRGIAFKLFAITSAVLIGLLTLLMLSQLLFFEKYYLYKKESEIRNEWIELRDRFVREKENPNTIPLYFLGFEDRFGAMTAIGTFQDGQLHLTLSQGSGDGNRTIVRTLRVEPGGAPQLAPLMPFLDFDRDKLLLGIRDWASDEEALRAVMEEGRAVIRTFDVPLPGLETATHMLVIAPAETETGDTALLFAVTSLQPVGDAVMVLGDIYFVMYGAAIAIVLLLAFVYSGMLTKPLRALNRVALRMAKLDFSERSRLARKDELGNLSETLNFLADNLQRAMEELTRTNAQLQADIEREKRLEQLRKEFVAGVSHELKTPISLISGYAEALQDNLGDEARKAHYVEVIMDEAAQMEKLVLDMLDLSQLEAGQYTVEPVPFDIAETAREAAQKLAPYYDGKLLEIEGAAADVRADPFRIRQVLTNLLSNAIRHTPDGGAFGVRIDRPAPGTVRVVVWNDGEPIPEAELEHIWTHFYRVEKSRHRGHGGSGIGLAIVRQILRLHGSAFGARNLEGGVEFYFELEEAS
ncbi:HAMP domain-containing sensor histidine kinase [Paenibacillus sp.]|uniref:sensor histidine kinase n=1 Tax=Paenibacillus sp. TaxID=58172 RepID=UPI002D6490C8|nr:HAMP domain-containing sensor histidine kinase [Paenibacillus sp.]HZG87743.1 HAMP domain-containing sensor histidine kinase [Paenibacillus sp.]